MWGTPAVYCCSDSVPGLKKKKALSADEKFEQRKIPNDVSTISGTSKEKGDEPNNRKRRPSVAKEQETQSGPKSEFGETAKDAEQHKRQALARDVNSVFLR
jgi:hypothetical protein